MGSTSCMFENNSTQSSIEEKQFDTTHNFTNAIKAGNGNEYDS